MITIASETLVPLRDAPKLLPPAPTGKPIHLSAIYRWVSKGVAGVKLEVIRVGGKNYTSQEALQRFAERLSTPAAASLPLRRAPRGVSDPVSISADLAKELGLRQPSGVASSNKTHTPSLSPHIRRTG